MKFEYQIGKRSSERFFCAMRNVSFVLALVLLAACSPQAEPQRQSAETDAAGTPPVYVELQGHRGCRGLRPENTWPAFQHALDLGVTTLEMDVVLSADQQLIVSHEPWFNDEICTVSEGMETNLFQLTADEISKVVCGDQLNETFPEQQLSAVFKPRFKDVIDLIKHHCKKHGYALPAINVEIKSREAWQPEFQPDPESYVATFLSTFNKLAYPERVTVQSFDPRILKALHTAQPGVELVYLTDNPLDSPTKVMEELGFTPAVYSPYFKLATAKTRKACSDFNMELVVWTVNEASEMQKMVELGVDGIITDYPDRFLAFAKQNNVRIR